MSEPYIPKLWRMIDAAQRKLKPSREQVGAWERASTMLKNHAARLQACRDQLAGLWPPEQNEASAAYMAELDRLIKAAKDTSTVAQNNATHIDRVADAIDQARAKLEPIYQEYLSNEKKLADYRRQVEQAGAIGGAVGAGAGARFGLGRLGQSVGDFLGEGAMELFTSPPVSDAEQAALVSRARAIQVEVDGAARDGGSHLKPPPEYIPPNTTPRDQDVTQYGDTDSTGAVRPPVVNPPPLRRPPSPYGVEPVAPPGDTYDDLTHEPVERPAPTDNGPSLTGVAPPTPTVPASPIPPGPPTPTVVPPPSPAPPVVAPVLPGPAGPSPGGLSTVPKGPAGGLGRIPGGTGAGPGGLGTGVPPGGIIGARPGGTIGATPGGIGALGTHGASRVNPVGGVIGQPGTQGAGGRPGAAGGIGATAGAHGAGGRAGATGMIPGQSARRRSRNEPGHGRWDPDNPWAVEEGVAPEIEPNRDVDQHEPGTGVIGKDR